MVVSSSGTMMQVTIWMQVCLLQSVALIQAYDDDIYRWLR